VPRYILQEASDIANVMQKAGDDQMRVVVRFDALGQRPATDDVPPRQCDEDRVPDVVIQGVTFPQALQGDSGNPVPAFGFVLVR